MLRVRFWRKKNFYLLWPFAAIISGGILLWLYMLGNSLHVVRKLNEPRVIPGHVRQLTSSRDRALIVWWNMMPESYNDTISLEHGSCQVSGDRRLWKEANIILFYGSAISANDLPLPRSREQLWGLMHEESPRNLLFMQYEDWLKFFNYTATFSRHSDLSFPTYYLPSYEDLIGDKFLVPLSKKSKNDNQSLVLFLQSDCVTMTGREDYVRELMQHIAVDSFGLCLKNRNIPPSLQKIQKDYLNNLYAPELMRFIASYKYMIAYENGMCDDYLTEKFWRPLIAGTVPIFFGTPTVKDWAPNRNSYIDITEFPNPAELAAYLKMLSNDDESYMKYLTHKYAKEEKVSNYMLLSELSSRELYIGGEIDIMFKLEGEICKHLWDSVYRKSPKYGRMASIMDYNCATEPQHPRMDGKVSHDDDWSTLMAVGRCEAKLLNKLLSTNKAYTKEEYEVLLDKEVNGKDCEILLS